MNCLLTDPYNVRPGYGQYHPPAASHYGRGRPGVMEPQVIDYGSRRTGEIPSSVIQYDRGHEDYRQPYSQSPSSKPAGEPSTNSSFAGALSKVCCVKPF